MSSVPLIIKNGGKSYNIEVDLSESGLVLKNQIFSLTNIPADRQKVLLKGGQLKDDILLAELNFKPNQAIMVLGTADSQLPQKPVNKPSFIEDLSEHELGLGSNEPSGLVNLGNTCYLNSSLQALFEIQDVQDKLNAYEAIVKTPGSPEILTYFLKTSFQNMNLRRKDVTPLGVINSLRACFPQFAERANNGSYKQQDAEEAFSQILSVLRGTLKIEDLFKLQFKVESNCVDTIEEPTYSVEEAYKLNCHITLQTNFLRDGIINGLKETIEKHNESVGGNVHYELKRTITRLPKYLTVNFVRFYWRRDTQKKSKILRKVQFPFELDLSEFLDESIKPEKVKFRESIRTIDKERFEAVRDFKKSQKIQTGLTPLQIQKETETKIEVINKKFREDFEKVLPEGYDLSKNENPSSLYELTTIITHQGSSADSGHYQCFVKDKTDLNGEKWWKFNDNKVSVVDSEKIQQLAGGGESDSALILIYKGFGL